ncbi:MAG: hypothetical protein J1F40_05735 [Prevotellaceae bacterium]|nr:hypothetical protein [Prevotellaceae bacterium]
MKRKLLFLAAVVASALGFNANAQKLVAPEKPTPQTTELVDDGNTIQYLYNVKAGGFFLGANDYGTRASVDAGKGFQFKVTKNSNGSTWTLNNRVETKNNGWFTVFADNAEAIYVDRNNQANYDNWVITPLEDDQFKISNQAFEGNLSVVPSNYDTRLYLSTDEDAQDVWAAVSTEDYTTYSTAYSQYETEYAAYLEAFKTQYTVGDDVVILAPTAWEGATGVYGPGAERYNQGSIGAGDVLTQTFTGLKNGVYTVTLKVAASFTSNRGFECPTGEGLSVAFAQDKTAGISVVDRGVVGGKEYDDVTLTVVVTNGTLKYGIKNIAASGNWYVASVTSIIYDAEIVVVDDVAYKINSENLFVNGSFDEGVTGWKACSKEGNTNKPYSVDADISNFTYHSTGGFDNGAYITTNGAGVSSEKTLCQSVEVESGKAYYFSVYTSGKAPDANNFKYNALFKMSDATTEYDPGVIKEFGWPQGAGKTTAEWSQTEYVFTAGTPYVGVRMGWNESTNFDGFVLYEVSYADPATEDEYKALNAAIEAVEGNTLGFEVGQYAPYANVEAINALAAAKAIDQDIENNRTTVVAATEALTKAEWTENTEAMNAIYNGDFALSTPNANSGDNAADVPGWSPAAGLRMVIEDGFNGTYPGLAGASAQRGVFVHAGQTYKYGETVGYTMPLEANSVYELTFKYTGWNGGDKNFTVSVKDAEGGDILPTQICGLADKGPQVEDCWYTYTTTFATTDAGNVILNMMPIGNATFTDITLYKYIVNAEVSEAGWATFVTPVAVDFGEEVTAYVVQNVVDAEDDAVSEKVAKLVKVTTAPANTPVVLEAEEGTYTLTAISEADEVDNILEYATEDMTEGLSNIFVLANPADGLGVGFYALKDDVTSLPAGTVYLPHSAFGIKFIGFEGFDYGATAIKGVDTPAAVEDGVYYNLAGQRVQAPSKGIYIVNGQKVLVK